MRGLAALMVAFHHSLLVITINGIADIWQHSLLEPMPLEARITQILLWLTNGSFAVMIFMVLSGWSLSQSGAPLSVKYCQKRFWRLYPTYAAMTGVLASWWYSGMVPIGLENASTWWNWWFQGRLTFGNLMQHLTFLQPGLSGVSWTMQIIVLSSLVAPLLIAASRGTKIIDDLLIIANIILMSLIIHQEKYLLIVGFYAGMLLTKYNLHKLCLSRAIYLFVVLGTMAIRYLISSPLVWIAEAIGAFLLVSQILQGLLGRWLVSHWLVRLGTISYSFYLWHFVILYGLTPRILPVVGYTLPGMAINGFITIAVTLPLAILSQRWLEKLPAVHSGV